MDYPRLPRSPLWLIVLALACEEPMHPYRMGLLIKQRGKDQVANVAQRNSVNQTVEALCRAGYIAVRDRERESKRPERTTYVATPEGRKVLGHWLRQALATPAREFPMFPAALATLDPLMFPDEFIALLAARSSALAVRAEELSRPVPDIPRIFLIESEYMLAMTRAEIKWLNRIGEELTSRELAFPSAKEMSKIGSSQGGASKNAIKRVVLAKKKLKRGAPFGDKLSAKQNARARRKG